MLGCKNKKNKFNCIWNRVESADKATTSSLYRKVACNILLGVSLATTCMIFSGCGKELTDQDIKGSKLYQDLETDYTTLQRKYDKLEKSSKKASETVDSTVADYLSKIKASHFVKLSYVLHNTDIGDVTENKSLVKHMKDSLADAIFIADESVADCKKNRVHQYIYTFYNEDNSLCKCDVYADDRVIFEQFSDKVFLVEGITRLGDGMIKSKDVIPVLDSSIYTKLYHAQIAFLGDNLMAENKMQDVVGELFALEYKEIETRPEDAQGEPKKVYTYYVDGEKYLVHVYEQCFSVEDDQINVTWFGKVIEESTEERVDEASSETADAGSDSQELLGMQ